LLDTDGDGETNDIDTDDDGDGIPDAWENSYSLDPLVTDQGLDPDGDGFTNGFEYVTDTNPRDEDSKQTLVFERMEGSGDTQTRFSTSSNRSYVVEFRDELTAGSWSNLGSFFVGTGSETNIIDSAAGDQRFYRLKIKVDTPAPATFSTEDFQSNDWAGGIGWSGDWVVTGGTKPPDIQELSGNYSVRLRDGKNAENNIVRTLSSGVSGATLTFKWDIDDFNSGPEEGYAEVFDGTWHIVWTGVLADTGTDAGNSPDALVEERVDLSAYGTVTQVRFRVNNETGSGDYLFIDDVELSGN